MKRGKGVRQHGKTAKTKRGGLAIKAVLQVGDRAARPHRRAAGDHIECRRAVAHALGALEALVAQLLGARAHEAGFALRWS